MTYTAFRGMKPFSQLLFTSFIILAVFLVFQLVAGIVAIPVFGFSRVTSMLDMVDMSDPVTVAMLKYFQVIQGIGLFIVPALLAAWLLFGDVGETLYLKQPLKATPALLVILLILSINPFMNFLGAVNSEMHLPGWLEGLENWMRQAEETATEITEAFLKVNGPGGLLFNLFMIALLPALGEELLFRGVIQKILTAMTRNHHWGIWLAAALFSALHMQFFGFVPRLLLGALFGYLLVWSGSLWMPILAHFINNAGAVTLMYLADKGIVSRSVEEFGTDTEYWIYALPSMIIGLAIMWTIRHHLVIRRKEII